MNDPICSAQGRLDFILAVYFLMGWLNLLYTLAWTIMRSKAEAPALK